MEIIRRSPVGGRQNGRSRALIFILIAVATAAAAGYILQVARQPATSAAVPESGFDLSYVPAVAPSTGSRPPPAPKSSLVGVIGAGALAPQGGAPAAPSQPTASGLAQAALQMFRGGVVATKQWTGMIASPAAFLVGHTQLASAAQLRGFLAQPGSVERYASHPLVQEVLNSPKLVGLLLRPSIARAFVASPAMSDDAAVDALLKSALLARALRAPGVQEAMSDNADAVQAIAGDPQVAQWLGKHPAATAALGQVNPAFSALSLMSGAGAPPR